ncbi:MAG: VTT domain-containing protein [Vicinamibacterales bacterium]
MSRLIQWVETIALSIGGPGIFLVAFLDSSVLSLPEINDLLLIAAVIKQPYLLAYYATMAVVGSLAGCYLLYYLGRRGGEVFLRKRFKGSQLDKGMAVFRRYGLLAVLVPSLLPPPAPFKIFVLLAGVVGISPWSFGAAIGIGRAIRYFGEGYLAVQYGEQAIEFLKAEGNRISLALAVIALLGGGAYAWWRRVRRPASAVAGDSTGEL